MERPALTPDSVRRRTNVRPLVVAGISVGIIALVLGGILPLVDGSENAFSIVLGGAPLMFAIGLGLLAVDWIARRATAATQGTTPAETGNDSYAIGAAIGLVLGIATAGWLHVVDLRGHADVTVRNEGLHATDVEMDLYERASSVNASVAGGRVCTAHATVGPNAWGDLRCPKARDGPYVMGLTVQEATTTKPVYFNDGNRYLLTIHANGTLELVKGVT